ncbi:MAG: hypothetical protein JRG80_19825 [Deltaproteobacteria bacterium]|jgi:hypothetical protein|nr:hypothetical protein [Deltaproteobacteria bacterium]MBW2401472.1 hypothetical protein [Deltaproteobacteria bacterium]MBW2664727.1 hypothetical protein [Deltaproteobacteria bacterium]
METFLAALVVFALAMFAMAIGMLLSGRRLRGSCGGVGDSCHCSTAARARCAHSKRQAES